MNIHVLSVKLNRGINAPRFTKVHLEEHDAIDIGSLIKGRETRDIFSEVRSKIEIINCLGMTSWLLGILFVKNRNV